MERPISNRRVVGAEACETEKRILTLSGVEVGIASVRRRDNGSTYRRKRKAAEHEGNENKSTPKGRAVYRIFDGLSCRFRMRYLRRHNYIISLISGGLLLGLPL